MNDPDADVERILAEAAALPSGATKVELYAEAARIADTAQRPDLGFAVRNASLWPAYDGGRPDVLLVHYAWCLAHLDRTPDLDPRHVLWAYRWIASGMTAFPQVTRQQIDDAAADMARRYEAAGYSLRPVHVMRRLSAEELGDLDVARTAHDKLALSPRDSMCDDPHLERSFEAQYHLFAGDAKRAVRTAEPILTDTMVSFDRAFQKRIQSRYLVALVRQNREDFARKLYKAAYPVVRSIPRYLYVVGWQLEYLAVVGDLVEAVKFAERHVPEAAAATSPVNRFIVYRAARLLLDRLRKAKSDVTTLRLPANLDPTAARERWPLDALAARLDADLTDLAAQFDARNGNNSFAEQVAEGVKLNQTADRVARLRDKR